LFGGFEARFASGEAVVLGGRKSQALLAYLALNSGEVCRRDKLIGLLWSDRGESQARGSLRKALAEVRKALGGVDPVPLNTGRDEVFLDASAVEVDAVEFERLIADGAPEALERATELYRGDLLDSIAVHDLAFEDWLRGERERLHDLAREAFSGLLDHQAEIGKIGAAVAAARRLLALDPLQESSHRTLMKLYARQDDRAMAVKQYQACCAVLRTELGLQPDVVTERLMDEIREGMPELDETETSASSPEAATEPLALPDKPSIAVLPFINMSGDPEQEYFSDGITEDTITELSRFRSLFVIARNSSFAFKGQSVNVGKIGKELGVAYLVEGSVRKAGNRVRVTAQLVESATGNHLWAERYDRNLDDIFAVQDEVTASIVATLVGQIEDIGRQRATQMSTENLAAYDCVLRGEQHLAEGSMAEVLDARKMFERAIELDPRYARSWAGLALSYMDEYLSGWTTAPEAAVERSLELAQKAVAVDERDSRAHLALAEAYLFARDDFDRALIELEKAIDLNPNDYINFCFQSWVHALNGSTGEGIVCANTAFRLNPYAAYDCRIGQFLACFAAGAYDDALTALQSISSTGGYPQACLAACYAKLDHSEEASRAMNSFIEEARSELTCFPGEDAAAWREYWKRLFPFRTASVFEDLMEGMRDAGLPT